jgi:dTDP-4-amino-4,6-dideoxygalactose transaminase
VGVRTDGVPLGGFGDVEVFSFHATKILSATEGGCVCTNDDELAAKLRNMRSSYGSGPPAAVPLTSNGRFSEAQAAIALMSLEDFTTNRQHNKEIHGVYAEGLAEVGGLTLVEPAHTDYSNYQYAVVEVDAPTYGVTRDEVIAALRTENVVARRYFYPGVHRTPPYADEHLCDLPVTDRLCQRLLQVPIGALVTESDASAIVELLGRVSVRRKEVAAAVRDRS